MKWLGSLTRSENFSPRLLKSPILAVLIVAALVGYLGGMPIWVAVLGVVAYYSRGRDLRAGAYNLACVVTGLGLGLGAQAAAYKWQIDPSILIGPIALIFSIISVWAMGLVTGVRNIPSYTIGILIAFLAQLDVTLDTYFQLIATVSIGAVFAGLIDIFWPRQESTVGTC
ncbi:DUF1097 domain-containing protein [Microbulbifer sp. JMSA004]|uniref:DUF1097 domain-containing protein n=1 Tax=unclassified Microbulbifer TaxID=2619833 RepID=UPI0024AE2ECE|nr:DUF1097 domain-containing protein [Microbulbifer sp. VAAF005]WHI46238.1 DUF1097 domain-containing protein [Microbulbifer sp. VAAF005]